MESAYKSFHCRQILNYILPRSICISALNHIYCHSNQSNIVDGIRLLYIRFIVEIGKTAVKLSFLFTIKRKLALPLLIQQPLKFLIFAVLNFGYGYLYYNANDPQIYLFFGTKTIFVMYRHTAANNSKFPRNMEGTSWITLQINHFNR